MRVSLSTCPIQATSQPIRNKMTKTLSVTTGHNFAGNTLVFWSWGKHEGSLTPADAIGQALALINAAAISRSEADIAIELSKGAQCPIHQIMPLIRAARSPLPLGINPIYGQKTEQPLVECFWYGEQITMNLNDAYHHAQCLMEAAESARTDNFLVSAFKDAGLNPEQRERVFASFRNYRKQMEG